MSIDWSKFRFCSLHDVVTNGKPCGECQLTQSDSSLPWDAINKENNAWDKLRDENAALKKRVEHAEADVTIIRMEMHRYRSKWERTEADAAAILALVNEQAEDEGLWSVPALGTQPIAEAYLQQELRRLHDRVERRAQAGAQMLAELERLRAETRDLVRLEAGEYYLVHHKDHPEPAESLVEEFKALRDVEAIARDYEVHPRLGPALAKLDAVRSSAENVGNDPKVSAKNVKGKS